MPRESYYQSVGNPLQFDRLPATRPTVCFARKPISSASMLANRCDWLAHGFAVGWLGPDAADRQRSVIQRPAWRTSQLAALAGQRTCRHRVHVRSFKSYRLPWQHMRRKQRRRDRIGRRHPQPGPKMEGLSLDSRRQQRHDQIP